MSFREFDHSTDISTQLSAVNEVIPITGSLLSGSDALYIKNYVNITSGSEVSGGFWETVYDGSPTSISSSALMDMTYGHSTGSDVNGYTETFMAEEKRRTYREMAGLLLGGSDSIFSFGGVSFHELFFLILKRRIYKDEVRKGNLNLEIQVTGSVDDVLSLTDAGSTSVFTVGPAGDEASLFSGSTAVGKVWYNAGIVAFTTASFLNVGNDKNMYWSGSDVPRELDAVAVSGNLDHIVDGLRNRINNLQFHNQTNLHSTIYFCRALNSDFNYSTNPTFVDTDGRILPTSGTENATRTYPTTVGLYDINNNLLAVAKSSESVKKSPDSEIIYRIRLSY